MKKIYALIAAVLVTAVAVTVTLVYINKNEREKRQAYLNMSIYTEVPMQTSETSQPSQTQALSQSQPSTIIMQNGGGASLDGYNPTFPSGGAVAFSASNATSAVYTPFTGNQTAVVTADYADVKPVGEPDDFVPYQTALAKGTMDFVTGESQFYDQQENETYYYFELSCGLKVPRESITLQSSVSMPENSMSVLSSDSASGSLSVRLSTSWKVPYTMSYGSQVFVSDYNVSAFTADSISLCFNYTTSASGDIDCSGSDIVSSAVWSVSQTDKKATLTFYFKQAGIYYGHSLYYEGDTMVISFKKKPTLKGSVVMLDPGHGADDPGAMGLSVVKESDINLLVAYQVKAALEAKGVTVYMTRYGDEDINLEGRKSFARSVRPDLYVSIHSNASESKDSIGPSVYYYKPFSYELSNSITDELQSVYKTGIYASQTALHTSLTHDSKYYPFSVTRLDDCPSVLVELGYLTNDMECYYLTRTENQQLLGEAVARGIAKALDS